MKHFGRKLMSGFLAIFMSVAMLVGMLPVMGRKAKAADDELILTFSDPDYSGNILVNSAITKGGKTVVVTGITSKYNLTIQAEEEEEIIVVLRGVKINLSEIKGKPAILIKGSGAVTIKLEEENTVASGEACAGIQKDGSGKLTITGTEETGSLTAYGSRGGAGIGGGYANCGSNITISGGTVNAMGGSSGAGIGGGYLETGSDITISGGKVTAIGGNGGAGIGGGNSGSGSNIIIGGNAEVNATGKSGGAGVGGGEEGNGTGITITGGTVEATGGENGAGIGGGYKGSGKSITIEGGTVTATGGQYAAGIGGGKPEIIEHGGYIANDVTGGNGENISIEGGKVIANGGEDGAGIGGGYGGNGVNITIEKGEVTAKGGRCGAGIGGGAGKPDESGRGYVTGGNGESITVKGGTVTATSSDSGAGIGGGTYGDGAMINIESGTIKATGGRGGAGIGGGLNGNSKSITIEGGTIEASGGPSASGIGCGNAGYCESITIKDGIIEATGGQYGAGIGGGISCKSITIEGGTIEATGGEYGAGIGGGNGRNCENITINGGTIIAAGGEGGAGIGGGRGGKGVTIQIQNNSIVSVSGGRGNGTYYGNGAGIGNGGTVVDGNVLDGSEISIGELIGSDSGFDGDIRYYESGSTVEEIQNENANRIRYVTTTFAANGGAGTMDPIVVTKDLPTVLPTNTFTIPGHSIVKWNTEEDGKGTPFEDKTKVTFSDNMKLYVQWTDHVFENNVDSKFIVSAATCLNGSLYFKSCKCGAQSTETFEVGEALGHDYKTVDGTAVAPTCTKAGKEADQKCSRCDAVINGKEIAATGHTFDQEVVDAKYLKSAADCITAAVYYKSCKCGEKSTDEKDIFTSGEPAGHKWKAATGYAPKTCEVCGLEEGQKVTYNPIKGQVFVWTKGSKEPFVLTIKRSQDDVNCFLHYLNTLLDGAEIKVEARSGSTIITISAETLEKLSVGEHKITVVFDDWKADFALSIAEASADTTPVTGDTMPVVPIAVVMVAAFGAAGIAMRRKARMNRM